MRGPLRVPWVPVTSLARSPKHLPVRGPLRVPWVPVTSLASERWSPMARVDALAGALGPRHFWHLSPNTTCVSPCGCLPPNLPVLLKSIGDQLLAGTFRPRHFARPFTKNLPIRRIRYALQPDLSAPDPSISSPKNSRMSQRSHATNRPNHIDNTPNESTQHPCPNRPLSP